MRKKEKKRPPQQGKDVKPLDTGRPVRDGPSSDGKRNTMAFIIQKNHNCRSHAPLFPLCHEDGDVVSGFCRRTHFGSLLPCAPTIAPASRKSCPLATSRVDLGAHRRRNRSYNCGTIPICRLASRCVSARAPYDGLSVPECCLSGGLRRLVAFARYTRVRRSRANRPRCYRPFNAGATPVFFSATASLRGFRRTSSSS